MLYLPHYAGALRCVGQALQDRNIEVFDLKNHTNDFRVQGGDPNPPYIGLIEVSFSTEDIKILDREGQTKRGQSSGEVRFDSLAEVLRAVGEYIDNKRVHLRRVHNSGSPISDHPAVEIEYETRAGDVQLENLSMSFIREASVHMYKKRTRLSSPVSIFARRR
ncbi:MAG: hypothetical protein ACREQ2_15065 [Candidatus Binatia bacterium]